MVTVYNYVKEKKSVNLSENYMDFNYQESFSKFIKISFGFLSHFYSTLNCEVGEELIYWRSSLAKSQSIQ